MTVTTEERLTRIVDRAVDWDTFSKGIPKLHVVQGLYGKDQDGLAIALDERYKVAVHEFPNGELKTVPLLRSEQYSELSHDYVMDKIHDTLDGAGLAHKVSGCSYGASSGDMYTDIILEKAYKMDEEVFEDEFGVKYTDNDAGVRGEYRPIIKVRNSFVRSSSIQLGILRVVCSNGMIAIGESSDIIRFNHVGKVLDQFDKAVDRLISNMFGQNLIENMMISLKAQPIEYGDLVQWLIDHLGKRATLSAIDMFGIGEKELVEETDKWIAYNIMTWAATNAVSSAVKRERAMASMARFIND